MPFSHECIDCGAQFDVPDGLAGKQATCAACGSLMELPRPVAATAAQMQIICGSCEQPMALDDVVCLRCGFDARTGGRVKTRFEDRAPPPPPEPSKARRDQQMVLQLAAGAGFVALLFFGAIALLFIRRGGSAPPAPAEQPARASSSRTAPARRATLYIDNNTNAAFTAELDGGAPRRVDPWSAARLALEPGMHMVTVRRAGRGPWEKRVDAVAGRTYILDPAKIGRYAVWRAIYTRTGQTRMRRIDRDYKVHGPAELNVITQSIDVQLQERPAERVEEAGTAQRLILRKLPPRPIPGPLLGRMLDPRQADRFRHVYAENYREQAVEQGARQGGEAIKQYVLAQLEREGGADGTAARLVSRFADARWLPELTTWLARRGGKTTNALVLNKFGLLAGGQELARVYPALPPRDRRRLLGAISGKPFDEVKAVALLGLDAPETREAALRLLLVPELARDTKALAAVTRQATDPRLQLDWNARASLLRLLLQGGASEQVIAPLLASTLKSASGRQLYAAASLMQHVTSAAAAAAVAQVYPSLEERLRRQLVYYYYRAQYRSQETATEPFLLAAVKDKNRSIRYYALRVLALPKWNGSERCQAARLEAAQRGELSGYSKSQLLALQVQQAQQQPAGRRGPALVALLPRAGSSGATVLGAIDRLPEPERKAAHAELRRAFPGYSATVRSQLVCALAGTTSVRASTWPRFVPLLADASAAVRLQTFELLARSRRYRGIDEKLAEAATRETDAATREKMTRLLGAAPREQPHEDSTRLRQELRLLGVRLANKDQTARPRIHALTAHADYRVARDALRVLQRYPDPGDLAVLRAASRHAQRYVRIAAVDAAGRHGEEALALAIYQAVAADAELLVRKRAYDVMAGLWRRHPRIKPILEAALAREQDEFTRERYLRLMR